MKRVETLGVSPMSAEAPYLLLKEAAAFARLSVPTIFRLAAAGKLRLLKPSEGRTLVSRRELMKLIEQQPTRTIDP
jgi:hypothetical protein